jgi:hypothetical protein
VAEDHWSTRNTLKLYSDFNGMRVRCSILNGAPFTLFIPVVLQMFGDSAFNACLSRSAGLIDHKITALNAL